MRSSGGEGGCSDLAQTEHDRPSPSAAEIDAVMHQQPRPMRHDFYSTVPTEVATVYQSPLPSSISVALQAAARSSGGPGGCSDLGQTEHDRPSPQTT